MGFIRNSIVGFFAVLMCWSGQAVAQTGQKMDGPYGVKPSYKLLESSCS